jgi:cyanophycinase-like exopeptidase
LDSNFISWDLLKNVITDTHFVARDRMGRLLGFMARLVQADGLAYNSAPVIRAIAVDQDTALLVETKPPAEIGLSRVVAETTKTVNYPRTVYLLQHKNPLNPDEVCTASVPFRFLEVSATVLRNGDNFNLMTGDWNGSYKISASDGVLTSTLSGFSNSIYGY